MTYNEKMTINVGIIVLLFCLLLSMFVPMFEPAQAYDVAFADVGATEVVSATVETLSPFLKDVEWTLEWDKDKTNSVVYWALSDNNPYDYISLDIDGLTCTLTLLKYNKGVGIKITAYLLLTCTSVYDPTKSATCSIKLG